MTTHFASKESRPQDTVAPSGKGIDFLDSRFLSHFHSELARPGEERFRELHAAHAEPVAIAEARFRDVPVIDVPDSFEGTAPLDAHAHGVEKPHAPGHQALAARLVDGKATPLEDGGLETVRCGEDGGRKPRGTASDDRYVATLPHGRTLRQAKREAQSGVERMDPYGELG